MNNDEFTAWLESANAQHRQRMKDIDKSLARIRFWVVFWLAAVAIGAIAIVHFGG